MYNEYQNYKKITTMRSEKMKDRCLSTGIIANPGFCVYLFSASTKEISFVDESYLRPLLRHGGLNREDRCANPYRICSAPSVLQLSQPKAASFV